MRAGLALAGALLLASPAAALVVETLDPALVEKAPPSDPGWSYVGHRGGPSAVYLGRGWVITAAHVGAGPFQLGGTTYPPVPESAVGLRNPRGVAGTPDLTLFRVSPAPDLPPLPLRRLPPRLESEVTMIAWGQGRGAPIELGRERGWRWAPPGVERWGTNRISRVGASVATPGHLTRCFEMHYRPGGTAHEAQAAMGDSGGAVFTFSGGRWLLAGVIVSIATEPGQESKTAIPGNLTIAADVSAYRSQILRILGIGDAAPRQRGGDAGAGRRQPRHSDASR